MVAETITPVALRILRAEDLELLLSLGWRRSYERGETLLAAGERIEQVTLVEQGTLEVVDVADGRETTVRVIGAGEAIGIEALGEARAAEQAIRAATDTIAIVFRPREWEKLLESHPQVAARVAWALAAAGATERRPAAPAEPTVGAAPRAEVPASVARAIGELETALQAIRLAVRDRLKVATTLGYGPRFLHSTGQLHKGGPNRGVFIQITADATTDRAIPGQPYSFGTLIAAQALGDLQSLRTHGRRVVRLHLGSDVASGLERLRQVVSTL